MKHGLLMHVHLVFLLVGAAGTPLRAQRSDLSGASKSMSGPTPAAMRVELEPLSVRVYGDAAITLYRYRVWSEDSVGTARAGRITHTFRKTPEGWKIIGGMSMLEPAPAAR